MSSRNTRIDTFRIRELCIPFKSTFTHASASRAETSSVWVEALGGGGVEGQGEACPRSYVTGETIASARAFVARHGASLCDEVVDLESLRRWMAAHVAEIDANPAAWCAVELACLDAFGRSNGQTVEAVLGLPPLAGSFMYTAVVGDSEPAAFHAMVQRYARLGFQDFKVKLSADVERERQKLSAFSPLREDGVRVRADANNLWSTASEAVEALRRLAFDWYALEEPIRANQYEELSALADAIARPIVLDESLVRTEQLEQLPGSPSQWLVNVRVSKMGGLVRSLDVVSAARRLGIGVIVGAQVGETSLLTRAGLTAAHAAGPTLVAHEGAFGTHLLTADVCEPPIMFGPGGRLDVAQHAGLAEPGLGRFVVPHSSMLL